MPPASHSAAIPQAASVANPTGDRWLIGVDVGGTKIAAGAVAWPSGERLSRRLRPTAPERGGAAVLDDVRQIVGELHATLSGKNLPLAGIGLGLPELVDPNGRILSAATIDWRELPATELLHRDCGAPAVMDADVRAAARAEACFGAGREAASFLYVTIGTGVSACLVIDGRPYLGARGLTGTFASQGGLIPTRGDSLADGPALESFAGGPALARRYAERVPEFRGSAVEVVALAANGETRALDVVSSAGRAVGAAVAGLVNMLDPHCVLLGGGLGLAPGPYRRALDSALRAHVWAEEHRAIPIETARLGGDAGWIGAALAARPAETG